MSKPLRIGIAGLGTVGAGTVKLLAANRDALAVRCGRALDLVAVSARDRGRSRGIDIARARWFDDAAAMARAPDIDVVVELMGGHDGAARKLVTDAIERGKAVVTANKALIAHHGNALAALAESKRVPFYFEAAVGGGIPIVKALRESLAANQLSRVYGILNGTCNFILTTMAKSGRAFDDVLAEAQRLGYAEADPSFDVDGVDTAHKLAILSGVAFGTRVNFAAVHVEGIRRVSALDIAYARELGYRIKLLGIARQTEHGLEQRVHPCMVLENSAIAHVDGAFNAITADGNFVGRTMFEGAGAGAGPTASAVVGDLVDIARGQNVPPFGVATADLRDWPVAAIERRVGAYYLRLEVLDRPGVLADIAAILRDHEVSIESVLQRGRDPNEPVSVIMTMHETQEANMTAALAKIAGLRAVIHPPCLIRIENEL
ncbi:MAG: homoserine dehydrogenase [Alphaproteobacteria bacterium]|nr:homoserine dehydrogenase [Alphaproteobacteria bacterium]